MEVENAFKWESSQFTSSVVETIRDLDGFEVSKDSDLVPLYARLPELVYNQAKPEKELGVAILAGPYYDCNPQQYL